MNDVIIVGASGFGKEVEFLIEDINKKKYTWNILGYLDDDDDKFGKIYYKSKVLGAILLIEKYPNCNVVIAIGYPEVKEKIVRLISENGIDYPILIHPSVIISNNVKIGKGTIITAGNIITTDIHIGKFCTVNLNCTVGHDVVIEDYVSIMPSVNVSGNVYIGRNCFIGTGAQIIQGVKIAENTIIGAGSVVTKDTDPNSTYVGVPAKRIK